MRLGGATDTNSNEEDRQGAASTAFELSAAATRRQNTQTDAALIEGQEQDGAGRRWPKVLRRSLARGAGSLAAFTFGATTLSGVSAEVQHRLGTPIPGAVASARASIFKPISKRTVDEKLASVPAFMVTNYRGSPYLTPSTKQGEQVGCGWET